MLRPNDLRASVRGLTLMFGVLLVTLLISVWPLAAHAATINVDGTTCTLPEAIEAANTDSAFDGCTAGSGPDTLLLGGLTHSLTTGPFDPNGDGLTATPSVTTTIVISGGVGGATVQRTGAAQYRLFYVGSTGNLTLQKVTVRNGDTVNDGGAINNRGGRLTLIGSQLISNTAFSEGGGIYSAITSTLTLTDVNIISNTAMFGGGIANYTNSHATLDNVRLHANHAMDDGGAIYNYDSSVMIITNSSILSNTAAEEAGGIISEIDSTLTLINTDVTSNTAVDYTGGIANYTNSHATLDNVRLHANHTSGDGGGIYNYDTSVMTITNSSILSNTAGDEAGGIYNRDTSVMTIANSSILSNTTGDEAGGILNEDSSRLTINNSDVISNTAVYYTGGIGNYSNSFATLDNVRIDLNYTSGDGGGVYNWDSSVMTITNSSILSNTAAEGMGGLVNEDGSTLTVTNSDIISNTAVDNTGGIGNYQDSHATLDNVRVHANHAEDSGGGVYNWDSSVMTITNSSILSNTAVQGGGGIVNDEQSSLKISNSLIISNSGGNGGGLSNIVTSTVTLDGVQIRANHAISMGGGIYNSAVLTATGSKLIDNRAVISGSAIYQASGQTKVNQSCIFNNNDTAVVHGGGNDIDAINNWWGAPDGPGPIGPGQGDSLSANVTFNPFLTSTILGCSSRSIALAFSKQVSPEGELEVGQPVTYTLTLTNTITDADPRTIKNIYVTDPIPTWIEVSSVITTPGTSFNGSSYIISELAISETASIVMVGKVGLQLNQPLTVTNTAILTHAQSSPITATVANSVTLTFVDLGSLYWQELFDQQTILITGSVMLLEPSQYVDVTVQIFTSPTFGSAIATLPQATAAEVMTVTFPIGSTSQDFELSISTAEGRPSAVEVSLQAPVGAMLGDERDAVITLIQKSYMPSLHR